MVRILASVGLLAFTYLPHLHAADPVPLTDAEKKMIEHRKGIKDIHVVVQIETKTGGNGECGTREVWAQGNQIRGDVFRSAGPEVGRRYIDCINCPVAGLAIRTNDQLGQGGSYHEYKVGGHFHPDETFDPRVLGLFTTNIGTYRLQPIDKFIANTNRTHVETEEVVFRKENCILVKTTRERSANNRAIFRTFFSKERGYQPLRIEFEWLGNPNQVNGRIHGFVDNSYADQSNRGFWIPHRIHYQRKNEGSIEEEQVLEISQCDINQGIDKSVFTIAGMNLPNGKVVYNEQGYDYELKDGVLKPRKVALQTAPIATMVDPPSTGFSRSLWVALAFLLVIFAGLMFYFAGRRRRQ